MIEDLPDACEFFPIGIRKDSGQSFMTCNVFDRTCDIVISRWRRSDTTFAAHRIFVGGVRKEELTDLIGFGENSQHCRYQCTQSDKLRLNFAVDDGTTAAAAADGGCFD